MGAGTAGCVLANRLSAAGHGVLIIEAGPDTPPGAVPDDIEDTYPRSYSNPAYMWRDTTADLGPMGRQPFLQARVMGGGSSVMGMIGLRGLPEDYEAWEAMGASGWGWSAVLPAFERIEHDWDRNSPNSPAGMVQLHRLNRLDWPPFSRAVAAELLHRGYPIIDDFNSDFRDGHGSLPLSRTLTKRVSSASAYLGADVRSRRNLTICCDTVVRTLRFSGSRCVGLTIEKDGEIRDIEAGHVILSAGAVYSPTILMRSGIGPPADLMRLGIPIVAALPGVGANLQNHPVLYLATHLRPRGRQPTVLRSHFSTALRFTSRSMSEGRGDMFMLVMNKSSWRGLGYSIAGLGLGLYQPFSRGAITLNSSSPDVPPAISFNFLADERDHSRMVDALEFAIELMHTESVRPLRNEVFVAGYSRIVRRLNRPGRVVDIASRVAGTLLDGPAPMRRLMIRAGAGPPVQLQQLETSKWLRATVNQHTFGMYHVAGTCRMGAPDDAGAVVDPNCEVRGIEGLSVVDASVMPVLIRGNTNLPVQMIAEEAAKRIIRDRPAAIRRDPGISSGPSFVLRPAR